MSRLSVLWEYFVLVVCAVLFLIYAKGQGRFALDFITSWWAK